MNHPETWAEIEEFPIYAISTYGRVMNTQTEAIKIPSMNQQGIPNVILTRHQTHFRRSVPLLVARTFLPPHPQEPFDTPINMDGDRTNNFIENLQWRPRWFAAKYHRQFREPFPLGYTGKVKLIQTGETFKNVRVCAKTFGLLEKEIVLGARNQKPVFPSWFEFTLVVP